MNLIGLFSMEIFLSLGVVFSNQEFFLFTQELFHFTQDFLPSPPKKLRTPYSRNFTFITQEITNTVLKKFEGPYQCYSGMDGAKVFPTFFSGEKSSGYKMKYA